MKIKQKENKAKDTSFAEYQLSYYADHFLKHMFRWVKALKHITGTNS